jgi:hypothetical protein
VTSVQGAAPGKDPARAGRAGTSQACTSGKGTVREPGSPSAVSALAVREDGTGEPVGQAASAVHLAAPGPAGKLVQETAVGDGGHAAPRSGPL